MSRFNIAIVEDEPYAARFVERVVRDTGLFDVLGCFESAEELLESPVLKQVQALVSDIRLGGIDGLDMLRRIAAVNPSLHTVIVSGPALIVTNPSASGFTYPTNLEKVGSDPKGKIGSDPRGEMGSDPKG